MQPTMEETRGSLDNVYNIMQDSLKALSLL